MKKISKITILFSILVFMLSACSITQQGTNASASPSEEMMEATDMNTDTMDSMEENNMETMEEESTDTMNDDSMDSMSNDSINNTDNEEMMDNHSENMDSNTDDSMGMMDETPQWFQTELINVNTDQTFSIEDFHGKVVLVETMAIWCTNCKKQQTEVKSLYENMGMDSDLVLVALDIDPNETGEALKEHATTNNFSWIYAISPAEVSREISNLYGAQFVNPPSTPILIIDREGIAHPMDFGIKNADDLQSAIETYLNDM